MKEDGSSQGFRVLCLISIYLYLKDKHAESDSLAEKKEERISAIARRLRRFDSYAHVTNKKQLVRESYELILGHAVAGELDEDKLLIDCKSQSSGLSTHQKEMVFASLVNLARADRHVSPEEREVICQIGSILEIDNPGSRISPTVSPKVAFAGVALLASALIASLYFVLVHGEDNPVNTFKKESVVFSELFFNRFLIYQNRFNVESELLRRQAVYYLNGSAEVSFKPSQLLYDEPAGEITFLCHESREGKKQLFQLKSHINPPKLVDEVKPKPITEKEARMAAAVIGIAGGAVGAAAGAQFGTVLQALLPPQYGAVAKVGATAVGGVAAGAGGYFFTLNALEGMSLRDEISPAEERKVTESAKTLIQAAIEAETQLSALYKDKFKEFITTEYASRGKAVSRVLFNNCNG
jgi:hypothetical protein